MFGYKTSFNMLKAKRYFRLKPKSPRARYLMVLVPVLIVAGGVGIALTLAFGSAAAAIYARVSSAKESIVAAQESVRVLDVDKAIVQSGEAVSVFGQAQDDLARLALFRSLPYFGPRIIDVENLLNAGLEASTAVRDALMAVREVANVIRETETVSGAAAGKLPDPATVFKDLTPERKQAILEGLTTDAPKMRYAAGKAGEALKTIDTILADPSAATGFRQPLTDARAKLLTLQNTLTAAAPLAENLPSLLGYPDARHYLVFLENNTELRPTGGFLGTYGLLKVKNADLVSVETRDVYAIDGPSEIGPRPAPPDPIRKYIGIDKWYLRDANWSPDFTVAAPIMEKFFHDEATIAFGAANVPQVDGIIAVTPKIASDILRLVGPIAVDGKTYTADNLVDQLEFQVEKAFAAEGVPASERKNVVGKLTLEVIRRVQSFSLLQLMSVAKVIEDDLREKHLLVWFKDPDVQARALQNNWGGQMRPVDGDYLSVIDANLASLKTDPVVARKITYTIKPETDRTFTGTVAIEYDHRGKFDWKTTRYRTYTRVYLPAGSTLLSVTGAMENDKLKDPKRQPGKADVSDELGRRVFGAFISIEPGEKRTLAFTFRLAPSLTQAIAAGSYRLMVEKEAGTLAHALTLDLDFGKNLRTAVPSEKTQDFGDSRYRQQTDLRIDRAFTVGL